MNVHAGNRCLVRRAFAIPVGILHLPRGSVRRKRRCHKALAAGGRYRSSIPTAGPVTPPSRNGATSQKPGSLIGLSTIAITSGVHAA